MNARRGSAGAIVLLAIGMALATAGALSGEMAQRRRAYAEHQQRVQGREYALGARLLARGTQCTLTAWTIRVAADGTVEATGKFGTYRIAASGAEHWTAGGTP